MNPWFLQQVSQQEKENILSKHRELYNGYQTLQPKVPNEQPLYVQDFAKDKLGATMTNDGKLTPYTNKIYEQFDQHKNEQTCNECGGMMTEGECSECGWKGEMEEGKLKKNEQTCNECGGMMTEGECSECGWKGEMEEGKLKDLKDKALDWMGEEGDSKLEKAIKKIGDFLVDLEDKMDSKSKKKKKEETKEGIFDFPFKKKGLESKTYSQKSRIPYEPEAIEKIINIVKDAKTEEHLLSAFRMFKNLEKMNPNLHDVYRRRFTNAYKRKADELNFYLKPSGVNETTGKLDDIYKIEDLNPSAGFDYVEGDDNYEGSWEQMHSKTRKSLGEDEHMSDKHVSKITPAYEPKKGFVSDGPSGDGGTLRQKPVEKIMSVSVGLKEGGFTGGGNAPDMDLDNVDPAFDFESDGPDEDTYTVPADDMDLDEKDIKKPYDFVSGGGNENGGDVYPVYEEMKSAWDEEEELDEVDVSGSQGVYGRTKKPFAFVSTGPGKDGPYQTQSWGGEKLSSNLEEQPEDEDVYWEEDISPDELDIDLTEFNPEDKSWEEITAHTGEDEFSHVDEEIQESLILQKNKINEMMERMKKFN